MAQHENNNQRSTSEVDHRIRDLTEQAIEAGADMKYTQVELACLRSLFMQEPEKTVYAPPTDERQRPVAYVFPRPRRPTDSDTKYTAWILKDQICRRLGLLPPVVLPCLGRGMGRGTQLLEALPPGYLLAEPSVAVPGTATCLLYTSDAADE